MKNALVDEGVAVLAGFAAARVPGGGAALGTVEPPDEAFIPEEAGA